MMVYNPFSKAGIFFGVQKKRVETFYHRKHAGTLGMGAP